MTRLLTSKVDFHQHLRPIVYTHTHSMYKISVMISLEAVALTSASAAGAQAAENKVSSRIET